MPECCIVTCLATQPYGDQMKLLIRNLSCHTTEAQLREIFEKHGSVQSCILIMDKETGNSKGFGFIGMPRAGEARAAMIALNNSEVEGNKIRVKKAAPKEAAKGT